MFYFEEIWNHVVFKILRLVTEWIMVIEGHNQIWLKMSFYEKVLMIINYFVGGNILRNSEIQLYFYDNEIFIWIVSSKGLLLAYYISQEMNFIVHCICKRFWRVIRIYTKIGRVNSMNKSSIDMYEKLFVISYRLKFIHAVILCFFKLVNILPYLICVEMISFWNPW